VVAPQAPRDRQAVLAGEHQVEYDKVGDVVGEPGVHRLAVLDFAVLDDGNVETLLPQVKRQELTSLTVVVHDQQMRIAGVSGASSSVHR
jgi:hypothetical protein